MMDMWSYVYDDVYTYDYDKEPTLLTNTNNQRYRESVKAYLETVEKPLRVYIQESACDIHGRSLSDKTYFSIHTQDKGTEHGPFWRFLEDYDMYHYPEDHI